MEEKSKTRLSLSKLIDFLNKYDYILSSVYCVSSNNVVFVECRSPIQQKTFFIHIPSKYLMEVDESHSVKKIHLKEIENNSSRQFNYISDIRGPLLDCDLVSISSSNICAYKNSGKAFFYERIDPNDIKIDSEERNTDEPEDEITGLERQTEKVLEKIRPGKRLPKPKRRKKKRRCEQPKESKEENISNEDEEKEPEKNISTNEDEENTSEGEENVTTEEEENTEEEDEEGVEIVFQDAEGESLDNVKEFISVDNPNEKSSQNLEDSLERMKIKLQTSSKIQENYTTHDNTIPPELEDSDIVLGIVYYLIDIGPFYGKIQDFEKTIIKVYEQIDDNILDVRNSKFSNIKELTTKFLTRGEERLTKINEDEKNIKKSLIRLTIILSQTGELKTKIKDKPEKFKEEITNIDRIYNQTRKSIFELNMDLLRLQDDADELLSNYQDSLEELMEL